MYNEDIMAKHIDDIDKRIADLLSRDGRMTSTDIARAIGHITERSVRYRIERLRKRGVLEICAIPIPGKLGYSVTADVFIEVEPGKVVSVAKKIAEFENITYVACSTGSNDISVQVVAVDNSELFDFVNDVLGQIDGVRRTTTSVVPLVIKNVYSWKIPASIVDAAKNMKQIK